MTDISLWAGSNIAQSCCMHRPTDPLFSRCTSSQLSLYLNFIGAFFGTIFTRLRKEKKKKNSSLGALHRSFLCVLTSSFFGTISIRLADWPIKKSSFVHFIGAFFGTIHIRLTAPGPLALNWSTCVGLLGCL